MTQTPTHPSASAGDPSSGFGDISYNTGYGVNLDTDANMEHPATRDAQARQTNAHRATHAAEALHRHGQVSHSDADDMQQALVELLTDLHHLCDTCDLDLTPLYQAATLIHTRETQAA
ncbi:hypothetical protein FHR75_004425 [Kineococcus radiotolerans]|uniref:Uncharacterized protein n=1 Tax=Kineococcus radiotolerans TaxID=131568 RepID=A0A7W4TRV7_KINRA|nr:hypothetical protein [Kineococcus radiotolerans]MBB2903582.1 hypothetical protein [Kineococcus radiotolerans]